MLKVKIGNEPAVVSGRKSESERDGETNTEEMGAGNGCTGKVKEFSSLENSFSAF